MQTQTMRAMPRVCSLLLLLTCLAGNCAAFSNATQLENAKPGTSDWQLTNVALAHEIEGYASATSVNRGQQISLFVNTQAPTYTLEIFRLGWYDGLGGRRITSATQFTGVHQTVPTPDAVTGMVECNWTSPYTFTVPVTDEWPSGVYVAKLTESVAGKQRYIVFVVRDDTRNSDYVLQSAVNTFQAYNPWGGKSLYSFNSTGAAAVKVSFNRPYGPGYANDGSGDFIEGWEYNMARFLEREGYDVSYLTDVDAHSNPSLLLTHHAHLVVGHSEYWSYEMRQALTAARDQGIGIGSFSGNTMYWQVRYEASTVSGAANRTIVGYKDSALTKDPFALDSDSSNDNRVTTLWRNAPVNLPEDALLGAGFIAEQIDSDIVVTNPTHWVFANTGLTNGSHLSGLLGYEVDAELGHQPSSTVVLAHSPYTSEGSSGFSDMTIYTSNAGGLVFDSGSIQWSWGLDGYHSLRENPAAQQITRNVLARLIGNLPPTANAGGPYSGKALAAITFNGSLSSDPDGSIAEYNWDFGDGTTGQGVSVAHTYDDAGSYSVSLIVRDNRGSTSAATTTATISAPDPHLTVTPAQVTFVPRLIGTVSGPLQVTVKNITSVVVDFSAFHLSGDFAEENDCPASLAAGADCTVSITFHPSASGTRTGTFTIESTAVESPQSVSLSGTGNDPVPELQLAPTSNLDFGGEPVGQTTSAAVVTLTSTGTGTLNLGAITISGDFSQTNNCGATLAVGASCTVQVKFSPTVGGARTGTLTINSNASVPVQQIAVTGTGTAPHLSVSAASLDFAQVAVGTQSALQTVTVSNTGDASMTIGTVTITGPFSMDNQCASSLTSGASCAIKVTFAPLASGALTGSLSISTNAGNSAVQLSGTGTAPLLSVSGSSLNFASILVGSQSASQTVTVSNPGNAALTITAVTVSGPFIVENQCLSSVAPNGSCAIKVTFAPISGGAQNGTLGISSNAGTSSVQLSGTGTAPLLSVSASSLNFALIAVGSQSSSQTVTVSNPGNAALSITTVTVSGPFIVENQCLSSVAPNGSCAIKVTFAPLTSGSLTGALSISTSAGNSAVQLSGTGTAPLLSVSASSLNFSAIAVGSQSSSQTLTVSNPGNAALSITAVTLSGPFIVENQCLSPVAPNGSCAIKVTFAPLASGTLTGALSISTNAGNSSVQLSGTGTAPLLSVSGPSLAFPAIAVGSQSSSQTVTVSNPGNASLTITAVTVSGPFIIDNQCLSLVAPNGSCAIKVTFAPNSGGAQSGSLGISSNAGSTSVLLSGTGNIAQVSVSASGITFAPQLLGVGNTQTVQISNTGNAAMTFTAAVSGPFSLASQCSGTLQPSSSCTMQVGFTPVQSGVQSGTLTITSNASVAVTTIPISGTGFDITLVLVRPGRPLRGSAAIAQLELAIPSAASSVAAIVSCEAPKNVSCVASPGVLQLGGRATRVNIFAEARSPRGMRLRTSAAVSGTATVTVRIGAVVRRIQVPFVIQQR